MNTGDAIPFQIFPEITREQLKAYAAASGDPNPIHLEDEVARKMGLPGVIAHGMLSAALIAERAQRFALEEAGLAGAKLVKFSSRFKAMTFPGDVISVGGVVKRAEPGKLVLDLQAKNAQGEITTTGEAVFANT